MQEKLNLSRLNMLYGTILDAPDAMKINNIEYASSQIPFFLLDAKNVKNNHFSINGVDVPLFAEGEALFKRQALSAVFSSDFESALLVAMKAKIDGEKINRANITDDVISYSFGEIGSIRQGKAEKSEKTIIEKDDEGNEVEKTVDEVTYTPYKTVTSTFLLKEAESPVKLWYEVNSVYENSILYISCPSQYPAFLKSVVSSVTGIDKDHIVFYQKDYYAPFDEYLFETAITAAIAASAAITTGQAVEIKRDSYSRRGEIRAERITYISQENKTMGEEVTYSIEMGAFLPFKKEYYNQVMAAMIPNYHLLAFKADVRFIKSTKYPYSFYFSLGFAESFASTEYHEARLSDYLNLSPMAFKAYYYKDKRKFSDFIPDLELTEIRKLTQKTMLKSSFERKWASHQLKNKDYALLCFSRGNGFSSGYSISGFSTSFSKEHEFNSKVTYNAKGQIVLTIGEGVSERNINFLKELIKKEMGYEKDDDVLTTKSPSFDIGPHVLSRYTSNFSRQLLLALRKIKELRETESAPFSIVLKPENEFFACEFNDSGFASIAISVKIDERDYQIFVEEIYADYSFGYILDENKLLSSVKETILSTLEEMGAKFSTDMKMNVSFTKKDTDEIASPMQITRALSISSFLNAVTQALKEKDIALPLLDEDVLEIRRGN